MFGSRFLQKEFLYGRVLARYGLNGTGCFDLGRPPSGLQYLHQGPHCTGTTDQVLDLPVATGQFSQSQTGLFPQDLFYIQKDVNTLPFKSMESL